jgi:hypothetical protein
MSRRAPRSLDPRQSGILDPIEYEVLQEMASTLGRLTQAFEKALAAYKVDPADEGLLDAAGTALWHFVIQRELCGLRNTEAVLRDYQVPAAIRLRMGVARR